MRALVLIFLAMLTFSVVGAQATEMPDSCSAAALSAHVAERIAQYDTEIADAESSDVVIAAAHSLSADLALIGADCGETEPEATTEAPSGELVDTKDFDVSSLIQGTWEVISDASQPACANGFTTTSSDRRFILTVANDTFLVDDIFVWQPNLTFARVADGALAYNRNESLPSGVRYTIEYRIMRASPTLLEGSLTLFIPDYDCTLQKTFKFVLVDEALICLIGAANGANVRAEPASDANRLRVLVGGERVSVVSQRRGADSFVWFELEGGGWVRSDIVLTAGDCANVPTS